MVYWINAHKNGRRETHPQVVFSGLVTRGQSTRKAYNSLDTNGTGTKLNAVRTFPMMFRGSIGNFRVEVKRSWWSN
jgi:hypothetical protein